MEEKESEDWNRALRNASCYWVVILCGLLTGCVNPGSRWYEMSDKYHKLRLISE